MATRVFDGIKFCEKFLKRTSQETSLVQIGQVVWEEMFKEIVDLARQTTLNVHQLILKAPLEHVRLVQIQRICIQQSWFK